MTIEGKFITAKISSLFLYSILKEQGKVKGSFFTNYKSLSFRRHDIAFAYILSFILKITLYHFLKLDTVTVSTVADHTCSKIYNTKQQQQQQTEAFKYHLMQKL